MKKVEKTIEVDGEVYVLKSSAKKHTYMLVGVVCIAAFLFGRGFELLRGAK